MDRVRERVAGLQTGERSARSWLVRQYFEELVADAILHFNLRREDAEDLANDALLAAVQASTSFSFRSSDAGFHWWVMTIFRNKVRDSLRKKELETVSLHSLESSEAFKRLTSYAESDLWREVFSEDGEATLVATRRESAVSILDSMLDTLHPWERILVLCRASDVPYEEIACYTGMPPSRLKVYHARIKRKLTGLLAEKLTATRLKRL